MRTLTLILALASISHAGDQSPLAKLDGGTGFVVDGENGQYLLHCLHGASQTTSMRLSKDVTIKRIAKLQLDPNAPDWDSIPGPVKPHGSDGISVWELIPKRDWHALKIAESAPQIGDVAIVRGYPNGRYAEVRTRVRAIQKDSMWLDFNPAVTGGISGGPVLNDQGDVIGMITGVTGPRQMRDSRYWHCGCIRWEFLRDAVRVADGKAPGPPDESLPQTTEQTLQARRRVVAFVAARGCAACEFFKRDLAAGHFRKFNMEVVTLNNGIWSDGGKAFEEFNEETKNRSELSMPVLWVPGTGQFKAGYQPERRGGIIGFLTGAVELLIGIVDGKQKGQVQMPRPYVRNRPESDLPEAKGDLPPAPIGVPSELEEKLAKLLADVDDIKNGNPFEKISALRSLRSDVEGMKGQITSAETKADLAADGAARLERMGISGIADDVKALKDGNVLQKVKALASLKGDVKAAVDGTKAELSELKQEKSTNPLHALWGLIGLVTGVIHEIKGRR